MNYLPFNPSTAVKSSSFNLLIVVHDPAIHERLLEYLSGENYRIIAVSYGDAALELIHQGLKPHLILIEAKILRITGGKFFHKIRETWQPDELPLIVLNDDYEGESGAAELTMVANDYLNQPIQKNELIARINTQLKFSKLNAEIKQLRAEKQALKQENTDLKILLDTSNEHGDTVASHLQNQADQAIYESERRLAQFLEAVPVGVRVLDTDGKLYFMNQKAKDIFGKGVDTTTTIERLSEAYNIYLAGTHTLYPPEDLPIVRAIKGETATADNLEIHHDDRIIPVEVWATPIYDEQGHIIYGINALQDITVRKQAEKVLENYNRTLENEVKSRTQELCQTLEDLKATQTQLLEAKKMAALGNLVAGIAHEISTPIGTAMMTASFLDGETQTFLRTWDKGTLKRSELTAYLDTAKESSQLILSNLQRAGELIHSFKQVSVDQVSSEKRYFSVKKYLEEALLNLTPRLKQTQHLLTVEGDETLEIESYPGALSQIATNLVMNSIIHAYQAHEQGALRFQVIGIQHRVIIQYTDNGCGIPSQHLDKIFEPFFTTARFKGGSGLGLHIVYNLVTQKLQGTIRCESQVGVGTKLIIELPIVIQD